MHGLRNRLPLNAGVGRVCGRAYEMPEGSPTLIYDGECAVCRYWVAYWRGLTAERVVYRPYQEAAADFPAIPLEAFRLAIQLIETDGRVYSARLPPFEC